MQSYEFLGYIHTLNLISVFGTLSVSNWGKEARSTKEGEILANGLVIQSTQKLAGALTAGNHITVGTMSSNLPPFRHWKKSMIRHLFFRVCHLMTWTRYTPLNQFFTLNTTDNYHKLHSLLVYVKDIVSFLDINSSFFVPSLEKYLTFSQASASLSFRAIR
jgi:hypothetical protein